jgi:hypothetical protein
MSKSTLCAILIAAAIALPAFSAKVSYVDITWMSIANMFYEIGDYGLLTDGYITRIAENAESMVKTGLLCADKVTMSRDLFAASPILLRVTVLGREMQMPENETILRGFQYASPEMVAFERFCWNGDCDKCTVTVRRDAVECSIRTCQTDVWDGMQVTSASPEIQRLLSADFIFKRATDE